MNPLAFATMAFGLGQMGLAQPGDTLRADPATAGKVWIEGSSNVGSWRCGAGTFDARVELAAPAATAAGDASAATLRSIVVNVGVRDLKCGNRKMDHDLYAALGASDPARPARIIARFEVVPDSMTSGGAVPTRGTLVVAGVERPVVVPVTLHRSADGVVYARGTVPLRMTAFGVEPPVGLFGLVRSRNEITVSFDLAISRP